MVKSTRKGKMNKKRGGTRKIKGGSRPPAVSSPAKFSFGGLVDSIQSHVDDTLRAASPNVSLARNVNIHDLNIKKAHRGGSKTQKGGMDLSGLLDGANITIDNAYLEKKRQTGGMSCGSKKHGKKSKKGDKKHGKKSKKHGGYAPIPTDKQHGGMAFPGGGKKSKKGGRSKYHDSLPLPSTSSWRSHFPYGIKNY